MFGSLEEICIEIRVYGKMHICPPALSHVLLFTLATKTIYAM